MSRLIFSTRVDGTDVPVFFSGTPGDKTYVGATELLNILGHSKTHLDEFPRSETKLWQDLAPGDATYPASKLFTTEVGFAVYFGKTKLGNWASFKRMFDTINTYLADSSACSPTNPLCMIPPGHNIITPCPLPNPSNRCETLNQILQTLQNNSNVLQTILIDVQKLLAGGGGGGGDLTPVLNAISDLQTLITNNQNVLSDAISALQSGVDTNFANLDSKLNTLNDAVTAATNAITSIQNDVNNLLTNMTNTQTGLTNVITTLNAYISGAIAQWGATSWDTTTHPVPTIPPIETVTAAPRVTTESVSVTLDSLQKEVKRLSAYTDDFEKLLKSAVVKV
uniref:Polyhedral envelope protein-p10 n=1 Tax=Adoxophyes orana granulovirus TaxID=170617 RepID=A0A0A0VDM8_GVAO|nr:polyhedral envelope protein-p10 [Adoxophyes orana granulovirus]